LWRLSVHASFVSANAGNDSRESRIGGDVCARDRIGERGAECVAKPRRICVLPDFIRSACSAASENAPRVIGDDGNRRSLAAVDAGIVGH
jgi:hypothetical protein